MNNPLKEKCKEWSQSLFNKVFFDSMDKIKEGQKVKSQSFFNKVFFDSQGAYNQDLEKCLNPFLIRSSLIQLMQ